MNTSTHMKPDWDSTSDEVRRDQRAGCDAMRERCPVAYSELMQWSLFRHEDVIRVLHDHASFSDAVSKHLSVARRLLGFASPTTYSSASSQPVIIALMWASGVWPVVAR